MKILSTVLPLLAIASTVSLSACSTMGPGETASATPPRLVSGARGVSTGGESIAWDRADAFGPVPVDLRARGQAACDRLEGGGWTPTGYHPMAQYADGSTSPTGGYYCQQGR
jgi:hypothetical protein